MSAATDRTSDRNRHGRSRRESRRETPLTWRTFLRTRAPEIAVFGVALALRLVFVQRLRSSVLWGSLHSDEEIYWQWSTHILSSGPVGPHPFFMGPLYPYVLAAIRWVTGIHDPAPIVFGQAFLGALACALLTAACRTRASTTASVLAGLYVAGYGMAILHDGLILTESVLFALHATLVLLAAAWPSLPPRRAALLGAIVGLATQGRAVSAVGIPALMLASRAQASALIMLAGAFVAVCLPAALHNRIVASAWIPTTYNLGFNAYVGNHEAATGSFVPILGSFDATGDVAADYQGGANADGSGRLALRLHRPVGKVESSGILLGMAARFVRDHPADALRLAARKFLMVWNMNEFHQIESMAVFTQVLGFVGVTGFAPLALFALPAMLRRATWRDPYRRFLALGIAGATLALLPFFVTDRYRLHLVPYLLPFAAIGWDEAVGFLRTRRMRRPVVRGVVVLGAAALVFAPLRTRTPDQVRWSVASDLGSRWLQKGRPDVALLHFREAVALEGSGRVPALDSQAARSTRAALYEDAGTATLALGDSTAAVAWLERAHAMAPDAPSLRRKLAMVLLLRGDRRRGAELAPTAEARHALAAALVDDARVLEGAGDVDRARRHLEAAVSIDGRVEIAWTGLIRLAILERRHTDAAGLMDAAARAGYPHLLLEAHRAWAAHRRGDQGEAERIVSAMPGADRLDAPTRATLQLMREDSP